MMKVKTRQVEIDVNVIQVTSTICYAHKTETKSQENFVQISHTHSHDI